MRALIAATAVVAILAGVSPASAGPWHRWNGPNAGPRAYGWGWGGPRRVYGGYGGGYGYGGFGGGGHQTATGGPSGGRIGGS